jgi:hypothetical protein
MSSFAELNRVALPVLCLAIFLLWIRNKMSSSSSSTSSSPSSSSLGAVIVLAENRWLCDAMKEAGYSDCVQFDVRNIQSIVELLRTDDLDTLTLLSAAQHVVLAESNVQLIALAATPEQADDRLLWTTELRTAINLLRARFRIDRPVFLPAVPPRDLVGAMDFAPVTAFIDAHVRPLVPRVAPTWCVFERIVNERNDTTYAYMPDNFNVNHHGSYAVAAMLHAHFRPDVPWRAKQKLPDGMSAETALYFMSVVQECSGSRQK